MEVMSDLTTACCVVLRIPTNYRAHNILIPNPEELKLGDTRKYVTGALAIGPEPGTYFNMHVLDFESLYPGCIDVFNLSYETIQCPHPECEPNQVPGQPGVHVCTKRRGTYSADEVKPKQLPVGQPVSRFKTCSKCGASANSNESKYCGYCGNKF